MSESALRKKVDLLEKALLRERSAKAEVERQLEVYSRESYRSHGSLVDALQNESLSRKQLEFLAFLTERIGVEEEVNKLRISFANLLTELLDYTWMASIAIANNELISNDSFFLKKGEDWKPIVNSKFFEAAPAKISPLGYGNWLKLTAEDSCLFKLLELSPEQTLLTSRYSIDENIDGSIIIMTTSDIPLNVINTLNLASNQLGSALAKLFIEQSKRDSEMTLDSVYQQLEDTQKLLMQNEKMVSLGQMAAGIAHEINNPLSYMSSNLEICQDLVNDSKAADIQQHHLDDINDMLGVCGDGVEKIANIVKSMMSLARQGSDDFISLDISKVIHDALNVTSNRTKYGYDIKCNIPPELPMLNGNYGELQQVFVNLMANALDAMPDGGVISIDVELEPDYLIVVFTDTGEGIPDKALSSIFNPFFTTKKVNKGTGLGLSISYAILEKHDADIDVSSQVNFGTSFTLRFKLV